MRGRSPRRSTRTAPPSRRRGLFLPPLTSGDAGHDGVGGNVSRDHRAGSHESSRPDSNAAEDDDSGAERGASLYHGSQEVPIGVALGSAFVGSGAGELVVDEENPVPDEDLVLDLNAVADERVARDLAGGADRPPPLDLNEGSDAGVTPDAAAIKVAERPDGHVFPEFDVVDQAERNGVGWAIPHMRSSKPT